MSPRTVLGRAVPVLPRFGQRRSTVAALLLAAAAGAGLVVLDVGTEQVLSDRGVVTSAVVVEVHCAHPRGRDSSMVSRTVEQEFHTDCPPGDVVEGQDVAILHDPLDDSTARPDGPVDRSPTVVVASLGGVAVLVLLGWLLLLRGQTEEFVDPPRPVRDTSPRKVWPRGYRGRHR